MPSSATPPKIPSPIAADLATLSLEEVLRALALSHAADLFGPATQKAITRGEPPTSLLDNLMREELRAQVEERARTALKRSAIFPLSTLDAYDFNFPKTIDRDVVMRAAGLDLSLIHISEPTRPY